jgi:hypothetical protein
VTWRRFDNRTGSAGEEITGPAQLRGNEYAVAEIRGAGQRMAVYVRRRGQGWQVAGIERAL